MRRSFRIGGQPFRFWRITRRVRTWLLLRVMGDDCWCIPVITNDSTRTVMARMVRMKDGPPRLDLRADWPIDLSDVAFAMRELVAQRKHGGPFPPQW